MKISLAANDLQHHVV